jgi:hypothetical protein
LVVVIKKIIIIRLFTFFKSINIFHIFTKKNKFG